MKRHFMRNLLAAWMMMAAGVAWAALICQIGVIFIVTGLLRLLLQGQLT